MQLGSIYLSYPGTEQRNSPSLRHFSSTLRLDGIAPVVRQGFLDSRFHSMAAPLYLAFDESLAILHGREMPEHRHEEEVEGIRTALLSS
jgi:hypothetical protein